MRPNFEKFADKLVPVIIQDYEDNTVLMQAYMNEAAYEKTITEKVVCFFSRSKKRLWTKGESSGNTLHVLQVLLDCDQDCILIKAKAAGPTCHTGSDSCFGKATQNKSILDELAHIIEERKSALSQQSYIASLFKKGINAIAQKVGEEAVELIIEAKDNDQELFLNEAADLLFHYLILLHAKGQSLNDVNKILRKRHHKTVQEQA